jgi:hypothetical protein
MNTIPCGLQKAREIQIFAVISISLSYLARNFTTLLPIPASNKIVANVYFLGHEKKSFCHNEKN